MKFTNKFIIISLTIISLTSSAHAALIYNLDQSFDGALGVGPLTSPYLSTTFQQVDATNVSLTIAVPNGLTSFGSVLNMYFNYTGDPNALGIINTGGTAPSFIGVNDGYLQPTLFNSGIYDIEIDYPFASFGANQTSIFNISNGAGLLVSDFIDVNSGYGDPSLAFNVGARVFDFETGVSAIANTPIVAVPEPVTWLSLATLLILSAALARRKMQVHNTI